MRFTLRTAFCVLALFFFQASFAQFEPAFDLEYEEPEKPTTVNTGVSKTAEKPPENPKSTEQVEPGTQSPVLDLIEKEKEDQKTEAGTFCLTCARTNISDLQDVVNGVKRLNKIDTWKKSRGLVQIPVEEGNIGPCGTHHYNPDGWNAKKRKGELVDNYAAPVSACAFMSLIQKWKQTKCPDQGDGCRIAWGDISHRDNPCWNKRMMKNGKCPRGSTHQTHTHGNCFDIRPFQKGNFVPMPLTHGSGKYSRSITKDFITMAKSMGATNVYFNDTKTGGSKKGGHDNHVHICFPNSKKVRKTCADFEYNSFVCGEM